MAKCIFCDTKIESELIYSGSWIKCFEAALDKMATEKENYTATNRTTSKGFTATF